MKDIFLPLVMVAPLEPSGVVWTKLEKQVRKFRIVSHCIVAEFFPGSNERWREATAGIIPKESVTGKGPRGKAAHGISSPKRWAKRMKRRAASSHFN